MKSVKVSVLIPVYNTSETLARALDSVINQTMKEIRESQFGFLLFVCPIS